jgi:hypothetical protein
MTCFMLIFKSLNAGFCSDEWFSSPTFGSLSACDGDRGLYKKDKKKWFAGYGTFFVPDLPSVMLFRSRDKQRTTLESFNSSLLSNYLTIFHITPYTPNGLISITCTLLIKVTPHCYRYLWPSLSSHLISLLTPACTSFSPLLHPSSIIHR